MHRPQIAAWWRIVVALAALQSLLHIFLDLAEGGDVHAMRRLIAPLLLLNLVACVALAVSMMRAGLRLALAAAAGLGLAIATAAFFSDPFALLVGLAVFVPVALVVARPDPVPTTLASAGGALSILTMALAMGARGRSASSLQTLEATGLAAGLLLTVGFGAYAWRAQSAALPPLSRRGRAATVIGGVALLALSWLIGGHVFTMPLWPAALLLIVAPALANWRAHTAGAAIVAAAALAGALPVGTCTADPWSDAIQFGVPPDADAYAEPVRLAEVAGSGPRWMAGGGFTGVQVHCSPALTAAGTAWAAALAGASLWVATRPAPEPLAQ